MSESKETLQRMGTFDVSLELLAQLLHLPESDKIVHAEYQFQPPAIKIFVQGDEGSELPLLQEGSMPERVRPIYNRDNETGAVTFVKY